MKAQAVGHDRTPRRLLMLLVLSLPAGLATAWDEVLLAGPIVFLVQALGFPLALTAFAATWAALGLSALFAADFVWPRIGPGIRPKLARCRTRLQSSLAGSTNALNCTLPLGMTVIGSAAALAAVGFPGRAYGWAETNAIDLAVFAGAVTATFLALVVVDRLGHGLEQWVRSLGAGSTPVLRSVGALVAMVILGPTCGWPVFRILGYTRRSTYVMTLVAAPVFTAIWVPFYGLGVWEVLNHAL